MKNSHKQSYYVLIRGPLGCGKTTIAKKLAKIIGAQYVAIDRILDDHSLTDDWEEGYISQKSFLKANKIVVSRARKILQQSQPVIFDGNFYWKSQIDDLIERLNFPHHVFTLKAPLKVCILRDYRRRKTHGSDAATAVYKKSTKFKVGKSVDVTKPIDEVIKTILKLIPQNSS